MRVVFMSLVIVDSGVANLASVKAAFDRLGVEAEVTDDVRKIASAERVILPGVGSAEAAMKQLTAKNLTAVLRNLTQPVLGICLGMQLLFLRSEEGAGCAINRFPIWAGTRLKSGNRHILWSKI